LHIFKIKTAPVDNKNCSVFRQINMPGVLLRTSRSTQPGHPFVARHNEY